MEQQQLTLFTTSVPVGYVYVLGRPAPYGTTYKIGYSADPPTRSRQLRSELLATIPGTRQTERALHGRFDAFRFPGTEWFLPGRPLVEWVEALRARAAAQWN